MRQIALTVFILSIAAAEGTQIADAMQATCEATQQTEGCLSIGLKVTGLRQIG
jgi:hypothetical protein